MKRRPWNLHCIALAGSVAGAMSGYQVWKCTYNYLRANQQVPPGSRRRRNSEDKMTEIVTARGRGGLPASGLTIVAYLGQGKR